jgi:uncharacterized protein YbjT (DUF2867 family)
MKIVVIGGTGLIGSRVVTKLGEHGHEAVAAAPNTGVNTLTGEGLADAVAGASVVIDVSNSPSWEDAAVLRFFQTSTRNLLAAAAAAGVGHYLALSVVGTERLPDSGYLRAKLAQEKLIENSSVPFSLVHATQFFEFVSSIADAATEGGCARPLPGRVAARPHRCRARGGRPPQPSRRGRGSRERLPARPRTRPRRPERAGHPRSHRAGLNAMRIEPLTRAGRQA